MGDMAVLMDSKEVMKEGNGVAFVKLVNSKTYSDICDTWYDYQEWHDYWSDYR